EDHQHADGDHDHDLVGLLGLQWQAVQRVLEEIRVGVLVGQLGQADGVHFAAVEREGNLCVAATFEAEQRLVAGPPDQAVGRQTLFAGFRVEVQPLVAIEAAQPEFRRLGDFAGQAHGVHAFHGNVGDGQQQLDDPCLVGRIGIATQQQLHVVVIGVVDALDGFADEGLDVGRVLANRRQQGFSGYLLGALDGDAVAEYRTLGPGLLPAVALGQHQAVIQRLAAVDPARGPGHPAVAICTVDADAVVVGNEAFVEADEFLVQRRYVHLQLDRLAGVGLELDLGVDIPQVIRFVFSHRNAENEDLVRGNRDAQGDEQEDQYFQMQGKRAHGYYSSASDSVMQPGLPAT